MPGGRGKIRPEDNTNGFQKNPQNINRTGRNRKTWTAFNIKCKEKGIEPVTRSEYYTAVGNLMNMTQEELKEVMADKDQPQWLRWIIIDLGNKKIRHKLMQEYRDWMFGKAEQRTEVTGNTTLTINIIRDAG